MLFNAARPENENENVLAPLMADCLEENESASQEEASPKMVPPVLSSLEWLQEALNGSEPQMGPAGSEWLRNPPPLSPLPQRTEPLSPDPAQVFMLEGSGQLALEAAPQHS